MTSPSHAGQGTDEGLWVADAVAAAVLLLLSAHVRPGAAPGSVRYVCFRGGPIWKSPLMSSLPVSKRLTQFPNIFSGHHLHSHRRTRSSLSLQRSRGCLQPLLPVRTICSGLPQDQDPSLSPKPRASVLIVFLGQCKASAHCQGIPWRPWVQILLLPLAGAPVFLLPGTCSPG